MNSDITEAELLNIMLGYADIITSRMELFVAGAIAMIVAVFITKDTLNYYLRAIIILVFSVFSYAHVFVVIGFNNRMAQASESLKLLLSEQNSQLPLSLAIIDSSIVYTGTYISATATSMVLGWLCCVGLMMFPKVLVQSQEK